MNKDIVEELLHGPYSDMEGLLQRAADEITTLRYTLDEARIQIRDERMEINRLERQIDGLYEDAAGENI
jgi:hypothetical protein